MVMSEEQPVGQPPVNKKKDISAGVQAEGLAALPSPEASPSPAPSPAPTPHPGQALIDSMSKSGLYDPKAGSFVGLGALAALNAEMRKQSAGGAQPAPWLVEMINAQKGGTPYTLAPKKGKVDTTSDVHSRKQALGKE